METDVTDVLPIVRVPTLVLTKQRHEGPARFVAERIREAELRVLPGEGMAIHEDDGIHSVQAIDDFLLRCAETIVEDVRALGLDVRAGIHTGECELHDGKVAGLAVSIGARIAAAAGAGRCWSRRRSRISSPAQASSWPSAGSAS